MRRLLWLGAFPAPPPGSRSYLPALPTFRQRPTHTGRVVVSSCLICAVRRVQSVKVFQCFCLPLVRTRAVHVLRFPPSISKCLWIGTFLDFLRACVGLNAFTFYKLQRDFERGSGNAPPLESWVLFFNCEEVQCFTKLVPLTALAQD